jgi:hypothetical protein
MKNTSFKDLTQEKMIIRSCHQCGQITESIKEQQKCLKCGKAFLPLRYFEKVHDKSVKYDDLFSAGHELHEDDLIKGLFVLW